MHAISRVASVVGWPTTALDVAGTFPGYRVLTLCCYTMLISLALKLSIRSGVISSDLPLNGSWCDYQSCVRARRGIADDKMSFANVCKLFFID